MQAPLAAMTHERADRAVRARGRGIFATDTLPLGDEAQTPDDYVRQTSATTGLPHVMVRRNMEKIRGVLARHGRDPVRPHARPRPARARRRDGRRAATRSASCRAARRSASCCPATRPGVHALWTPAIALKTALVLKPGSAEPWTPYRLIQAFLRGGRAAGGVRLLPDRPRGRRRDPAALRPRHALRRRGRRRRLARTIRASSCTGPATARSCSGPDAADRLGAVPRRDGRVDRSRTRAARASTPRACGRPRTRDEIAEALAERLAAVQPRDAEDEEAQLAPFADARVAERISRAGRRRPARAGRARRDRRASRGRPARHAGRQHLPAADHRPLRLAPTTRWRTASSSSRSRRVVAGAAGGDAGRARPDAGPHRDHGRRRAAPAPAGLAAACTG